MRKSLLLLYFLRVFVAVNGQIITGTVLDKETQNPIPYAAVYFDGTSVASYTNEKGFFQLDVKSNLSMPLTVSALGYYSTVINNFSTGHDIRVLLVSRVFEMKDVTINAKGNAQIRKQNMAIFRREFLGRTRNAKASRILNEDDIRFITSSDKDTLRAFSLKPVFIVNEALGYKVTYYLNKFEYVKSAYQNQLIGSSVFDEDTSASRKEIIELSRNTTYYGSKMHFIRSLWKNDLKSSGYVVKASKRQLASTDVVRNQLSVDPGQRKKYLYYPEMLPAKLSVRWLPGKAESEMELLRNNIYIDENGYYKGPGILWYGEMARQGIADLLPYDFQPSEDINSRYYTNIAEVDTVAAGDLTADYTEKIYIHTDRDIYNPGDDLWFKAYLVDGITHQPSDSSWNLYVEIVSPQSEIVASRQIRVMHGMGKGDFILPDTISCGTYLLRAYTNYMRNFGNEAFFRKAITIADENFFNGRNSLTAINSEPVISFFPEGGSLVDNVLSLVAFHATNKDGAGCDVAGDVFSQTGELVTSFKSAHLGMGTFMMRPVPGMKYYASVRSSNGEQIRNDIPVSFQKGFVMNLVINEWNEHSITLRTNSETLSRYTGRDLLVTISSHGKILKTIAVKVNSLVTSFMLPSEGLPDGIVMITLFGLDNRPLCERLVFVRNSPDVQAGIETGKDVFKSRDSVSLILSVTDDSGNDQESFLSLSVSENIYKNSATTISSWFLLQSDVHGLIEEPDYYFNPANPGRFKHLDLLLLTHGWRDFQWKYNEIRYPPEEGFIISGRLRKSFLDVPLVNYTVTIGILQDDNNIMTNVQTDSLGKFRIELENLSGNARIVVNASDNKGNFRGRLLLDSPDHSPPASENNEIFTGISPVKPGISEENRNILEFTEDYKRSIKKKYTLSDTILIDDVQIIGRKKETPQEVRISNIRVHYGEPDNELVLTPQMKTVTDIRDLLVGRVSGIHFTKPSRGDSGIRIRGISSLTLSQEPLFLLDGQEVSFVLLSSVPVTWIDRIDVIKSEKTAGFGVRGANGVISVITKTSDDMESNTGVFSVSKMISGFNTPRIFYSANHSSSLASDYRPDIRSTLLWLPDIKVKTNQKFRVRFYNSDIPSSYVIIVEGITSNGMPVTGKLVYEVK